MPPVSRADRQRCRSRRPGLADPAFRGDGRGAGYRIEDVPKDGDTLIHALIDRCSYDEAILTSEQLANAAARVPVDQYALWFDELPETISAA